MTSITSTAPAIGRWNIRQYALTKKYARTKRTPRASQLETLTVFVRKLTQQVATQWHDLSSEDQTFYRALVDLSGEPPRLNMWERLRVALIVLRAGPIAHREFIEAFTRLQDTLTKILDREEHAFQRLGREHDFIEAAEKGWRELDAGHGVPLQEALQQLEHG